VNIQMLRVGNLVMLIIPGKLMLVVMAIYTQHIHFNE